MLDEPRFPLAQAAAFLLQIKTASYAPPDVSGELEGQFLAPKDQVVHAITQLIENELKTGYAYLTYANTLRGLSREGIAREFMEHAAEETEHTEFLLRRLSVLAGTAPLPDIPAPPPLTDPDEIVQTMIRIEQEGIAKWRLLRSLIGEENPMRFKVEEYLTREQHHLDELWQLQPHTPDPMPVGPEKVATNIPHDFAAALRAAGRAGDLAPELQEAFSKRLMRNQLLGGVAGAGLGGAAGALSADPEEGESRLTRGLVGGALGGLLGGVTGRYGTHRISGLNSALEKARAAGDVASPTRPLFGNDAAHEAAMSKLKRSLQDALDYNKVTNTRHWMNHQRFGTPTEVSEKDLLHPVLKGEDLSPTAYHAPLAAEGGRLRGVVVDHSELPVIAQRKYRVADEEARARLLSRFAPPARNKEASAPYSEKELREEYEKAYKTKHLARAVRDAWLPSMVGSFGTRALVSSHPLAIAGGALAAGGPVAYANYRRSTRKDPLYDITRGAGDLEAPGEDYSALERPSVSAPTAVAGGLVTALGLPTMGAFTLAAGLDRSSKDKMKAIRDIVRARKEEQAKEAASSYNDPVEGGVRDPSRKHLDEEKQYTFKDRWDAVTKGRAHELGQILPFEPTFVEGEKSVSQKELLDSMDRNFLVRALLRGVGDAGYGSVIGGTLGAVLGGGRSPVTYAGSGIGAALGAGRAYLQYKKDKEQIESERDLVAPRAEPGTHLHMPRWEDRPTASHVLRTMGNAGAGLLGVEHLARGRYYGGVPLVLGSVGNNLANVIDMGGRGDRDILEARAREYEKKHKKEASLVSYLRAKMAAENPAVGNLGTSANTMTEVPMALTPSGGMATGQMPMVGDPPGGQLPQVPTDVAPEQMDPQLLQQLSVEEQGREQQQQAAEGYYQEQATQAQQQIQQMQQQLEQQAQQAQMLEQQLQQEQQAKQQVQQMAQQSSEVANQALSSQLQSQMQALQSRQLATSALGQQDQFKQQLRELIDPPPAAAQDPSMMQQGGAPPPQAAPGMEQQQPKMASMFDMAIDAVRDFGRDGSAKRNRALSIGVPVAMGMAVSLQQAHRNHGPKAQESVDQAKQHLDHAQKEYEQDRSYTNAMRLLAAKGSVGAQEIRRDYPTAAAMATAPMGYATGRLGVGVGYRLKNLADRYKANGAALERKGLPAKTSIPDDLKAPRMPA